MKNEQPVLEKLNRLSDVKSDKDIKSCSHAIYPGSHCPLFGATMIASHMEGLAVLVIGTEECTYYNKDFSILRNGGIKKDRTYSYVLEENEVVFGCAKGVKEAIREVDKTNPDGILVITTCIPELIGEDIAGICREVQKDVNAVLMPVQTEHFNQTSHMSGIMRTLEAFGGIMKAQEKKEKTVNILGWRGKSLDHTELFTWLKENEVSVHISLPSRGRVEDVVTAPAAALNIVMDFTALKLAIRMEEEFKVPYVCFDRPLLFDEITASYDKIAEVLNIPFGDGLKKKREEAKNQVEELKKVLKGKSFVYGNTLFNVFRYTRFLCHAGMEPKLLSVRELYEGDDAQIAEILVYGCDPYVTKMANIGPLEEAYKTLKPDFYVGHEDPARLRKHGVLLNSAHGVNGIGYELPVQVLKSYADTLEQQNKPAKSMMEMMAAMMGGK
ncbi:MAG: oxalate:formate antiporter [Lachnospiraceae bacterium]|nr:oxalate:formate antiporter [Lachnospiraceae bacterium]